MVGGVGVVLGGWWRWLVVGVERGMVKCGGGWGSGEWVSRVGRFFRFFAEISRAWHVASFKFISFSSLSRLRPSHQQNLRVGCSKTRKLSRMSSCALVLFVVFVVYRYWYCVPVHKKDAFTRLIISRKEIKRFNGYAEFVVIMVHLQCAGNKCYFLSCLGKGYAQIWLQLPWVRPTPRGLWRRLSAHGKWMSAFKQSAGRKLTDWLCVLVKKIT